MTELKPCPFCGGKVEINYNPYSKVYFIACGNCDCDICVSVVSNTEEKAVKLWNRRVNNG